MEGELRRLLGPAAVVDGVPREFVADQTEGRGVRGHADAVVLPESSEEVAAVVSWCHERGVPIVPRGGGTGYAAGAVPLDGGVVVGLERMTRVRSFEPLLWRICVEAGLPTAEVRRLARENGLLFPPDPGGAEQSQIGGNIATNAGGPHAFKYGVTGAWVTGLEAVVPPGEIVTVGGPVRKDVAGYDVKSLLIGSEGTLGIVTAAWLRLIPMPEAFLPVVAFYGTVAAGCRAIERVVGNGLDVAALEFLDPETVRLARAGFPGPIPDEGGFLVLAEADGSKTEAARLRDEVGIVLSEGALSLFTPVDPVEIGALWRWRDGISIAVGAARGGKTSEDIAVPLEHLEEAVEETLAIGARHSVTACTWGHAGDGNLHSTFLVDPTDEAELDRAEAAAKELFDLALRLGGTVSGEHGTGWVKRGQLARQWSPRAVELHAEIKRAFDPRGIMNPGKKV